MESRSPHHFIDYRTKQIESHGYVPTLSTVSKEVPSFTTELLRKQNSNFATMSARRDGFQSIYTHHKDWSIDKHLFQHENQIESLDPIKAVKTEQCSRWKRPRNILSFSYDRPVSHIVKDFEADRQDFYSKVIMNKGYKISSIR